jgi:hypothetical protein
MGFCQMSRHVIALSAVLILGSVPGWPQESPGQPSVTLKVEVSLFNGAVFYIPAVGDGEVSGTIPLRKGRFVAVRITPRMRTDFVQIDVSALSESNEKMSQATSEEVRSWNSEDAGSYQAEENVSLSLSGFAQLGLPVLKVKIVRAGGPPPGGFHHPYAHSLAFCGCEYPSPQAIVNADGSSATGVAGVVSYPEAGKCVQISGCGQCCRTTVPRYKDEDLSFRKIPHR